MDILSLRWGTKRSCITPGLGVIIIMHKKLARVVVGWIFFQHGGLKKNYQKIRRGGLVVCL